MARTKTKEAPETKETKAAKTKSEKEKSQTAQKSKKGQKALVIVESPAKSKTIKKILGDSYQIEASYGHIRDFPPKVLGFDVANNFEPSFASVNLSHMPLILICFERVIESKFTTKMLESCGLETYAIFFVLSIRISSGILSKRICLIIFSSLSEITFKLLLPKDVTSKNLLS